MARRGARQWLTRIAAPALFLLAVTVAVLLVRSALREGDDGQRSPLVATSTPAGTATAPTRTSRQQRARRPRPGGNVYVIKAGDTFETVAEQYGTTTEQLRELNPGVDPVALTIGQRIRVP